jgi:hypothetical protein
MPYSDIDLNLCWSYAEEMSDAENYIFSVLATCDDIPIVLIENNDGQYRLQFKKENSIIKLTNNQLWYNKNDLITMMKIS